MSIVVYGPMGCGKTHNKDKLKNHFKMEKVDDTGRNPYPRSNQVAEFEAGHTMFLTHLPPPARLHGARWIVSFEQAMKEIDK